MSNQNTISIIGTVATDPRMVTTPSGVSFCTFRLASGERRYDRTQQKWVDGPTNWYGVNAFRSLAEHAKESLRKGERVVVSGRLRVRQWENNEKTGTSVEIEADALGHDLRWGVSRFEKRQSADTTGDPGSGSSTGSESGGESGSESSTNSGTDSDTETATFGDIARDPSDSPAMSPGELSEDGFLPIAA